MTPIQLDQEVTRTLKFLSLNKRRELTRKRPRANQRRSPLSKVTIWLTHLKPSSVLTLIQQPPKPPMHWPQLVLISILIKFVVAMRPRWCRLCNSHNSSLLRLRSGIFIFIATIWCSSSIQRHVMQTMLNGIWGCLKSSRHRPLNTAADHLVPAAEGTQEIVAPADIPTPVPVPILVLILTTISALIPILINLTVGIPHTQDHLLTLRMLECPLQVPPVIHLTMKAPCCWWLQKEIETET